MFQSEMRSDIATVMSVLEDSEWGAQRQLSPVARQRGFRQALFLSLHIAFYSGLSNSCRTITKASLF